MKKLILTLTILFCSISFGQNWWKFNDDWGGNLYASLNTELYASGMVAIRVLGGTYTLTQTGAQLQTILDNVNDGNVSVTEFGYLNGVTSAIQTQMGLKANLIDPTFSNIITVNDSAIITNSLIFINDSIRNITVPLSNTPTTPSIAFGDGDTGFYESTDDVLSITMVGVNRWVINASDIRSVTNGGGTIRKDAASSTYPSLAFVGDYDTGIGKAGADSLSLIAGGVQAMNLSKYGVTVGSPTGGVKGVGTINAIGVYDDGVLLTGADYIFEEEHNIKEMKSFYEKNKYLPDIGTWKNNPDKRPSVGDLAFRLLKTVEKQAMYIAELEERISALEDK